MGSIRKKLRTRKAQGKKRKRYQKLGEINEKFHGKQVVKENYLDLSKLANPSYYEQDKEFLFIEKQMETIYQQLGSPNTILDGLERLNKLSLNEDYSAALIDNHVVSYLFYILGDYSARVHYYIFSIVCNITASYGNTDYFYETSILSTLATYLSGCTNPVLALQCHWIGANLVMESDLFCAQAEELGLLPRLLELLSDARALGLENVVQDIFWILQVYARSGHFNQRLAEVCSDYLGESVHVLEFLRVLDRIPNKEGMQSIYNDAALLKRLYALAMWRENPDARYLSIRIIGDLCLAPTVYLGELLAAIDVRSLITRDPDVRTRREIYWILSNLAADSVEVVKFILGQDGNDLIPMWRSWLHGEIDSVCHTNLLYALSNVLITLSSDRVVSPDFDNFVSPNVLEDVALCLLGQLDTGRSLGQSLQLVILEAIEMFLLQESDAQSWLGENGGRLILEKVVQSKNPKISKKGLWMLENFAD